MDQFPEKERLSADSPFDVAADELRRYPDSESFTGLLETIYVLNQDKPLWDAMKAHVFVISVAENARNNDRPADTDAALLRGTLFGMHCTTSMMHESEAARTLDREFDVTALCQVELSESPQENLTNLLDATMEHAEQTFHRLEPQNQEILFEAALYATNNLEPEARFRFVQGFLFAAENTLRVANQGVDAA